MNIVLNNRPKVLCFSSLMLLKKIFRMNIVSLNWYKAIRTTFCQAKVITFPQFPFVSNLFPTNANVPQRAHYWLIQRTRQPELKVQIFPCGPGLQGRPNCAWIGPAQHHPQTNTGHDLPSITHTVSLAHTSLQTHPHQLHYL